VQQENWDLAPQGQNPVDYSTYVSLHASTVQLYSLEISLTLGYVCLYYNNNNYYLLNVGFNLLCINAVFLLRKKNYVMIV